MVILKETPLLTFPSELPLGGKLGFVAVNNSSKDLNYFAYKMKKKNLYTKLLFKVKLPSFENGLGQLSS